MELSGVLIDDVAEEFKNFELTDADLKIQYKNKVVNPIRGK